MSIGPCSQSIEVLRTRCEPIGIEIIYGKAREHDFEKEPVFSVVTQYPSGFGAIEEWGELTQKAHKHGAIMICGADLLALCVLKPPGEWGADIVYGTTQRFGLPMGFGGPHAAYIACREVHKRLIPGRLIGVSKMCTATQLCVWLSKLASNIYDEKKRPAIFAQPKCYWL